MENNYQLSRIQNYISGLMSKEDMYALEKEALNDPFLQDAIEGYSMRNGVDIKELSLLQKRLHARVQEQDDIKTKQFYSWQRLGIGLTAAVIFISVCILFFMRDLSTSTRAVETKEVIVGDQLFDYEILDIVNVKPVEGWETFQSLLSSTYSNSSGYTGELLVSFSIKANRVSNLKISGNGYQKDDELESLIRNTILWEGKSGHFKIHISSLKK